MTRKHFARLADELKAVKPEHSLTATGQAHHGQWCACVYAVADALKGTNDRFDRERFLRACGLLG